MGTPLHHRLLLTAALVGIGGSVLQAWSTGRARADDPTPPKVLNSLGLEYTPLPSWFTFEPKAKVEGWVAASDTKAMTEHSWLLWAALTAPSGQTFNGQEVAVFETWFSLREVFARPGVTGAGPLGPKARQFDQPRQLTHTPGLHEAAGPLTTRVTVQYTLEMRDHVKAERYGDPAVLAQLNSSWGSAPLASREIRPFNDRSVMLKPVWMSIKATEPTELAYWAGAQESTTPATPGPRSWKKKVLVVPPGVAAPSNPAWPVVSLDRFYAVRLSAAEAPQWQAKEGDYAILVGMHASTREIDNWTWQTSWWSFAKPGVPDSVKANLRAPFDNYQLAVGYAFTGDNNNPTALPVVCMNPYLEAGFDNAVFAQPGQLGIESNCMSCHRAAAWPKGKYLSNGLVEKGDPFFFTGNTKVDFVWGFERVSPP